MTCSLKMNLFKWKLWTNANQPCAQQKITWINAKNIESLVNQTIKNQALQLNKSERSLSNRLVAKKVARDLEIKPANMSVFGCAQLSALSKENGRKQERKRCKAVVEIKESARDRESAPSIKQPPPYIVIWTLAHCISRFCFALPPHSFSLPLTEFHYQCTRSTCQWIECTVCSMLRFVVCVAHSLAVRIK